MDDCGIVGCWRMSPEMFGTGCLGLERVLERWMMGLNGVDIVGRCRQQWYALHYHGRSL